MYTAGPTIFEPHRSSCEERDNGTTTDLPSLSPEVHAPEKRLTLFALRLAILEKAATGLGTLGFIWATVVLLGGFAITIDKTDFWFITFILLIEGARIFGRSHELEWQHQASWSLTHAGINSFRSLISSSISIWKTLRSIIKPLSTSEKVEIRPHRPEKWGENHCKPEDGQLQMCHFYLMLPGFFSQGTSANSSNGFRLLLPLLCSSLPNEAHHEELRRYSKRRY